MLTNTSGLPLQLGGLLGTAGTSRISGADQDQESASGKSHNSLLFNDYYGLAITDSSGSQPIVNSAGSLPGSLDEGKLSILIDGLEQFLSGLSDVVEGNVLPSAGSELPPASEPGANFITAAESIRAFVEQLQTLLASSETVLPGETRILPAPLSGTAKTLPVAVESLTSDVRQLVAVIEAHAEAPVAVQGANTPSPSAGGLPMPAEVRERLKLLSVQVEQTIRQLAASGVGDTNVRSSAGSEKLSLMSGDHQPFLLGKAADTVAGAKGGLLSNTLQQPGGVAGNPGERDQPTTAALRSVLTGVELANIFSRLRGLVKPVAGSEGNHSLTNTNAIQNLNTVSALPPQSMAVVNTGLGLTESWQMALQLGAQTEKFSPRRSDTAVIEGAGNFSLASLQSGSTETKASTGQSPHLFKGQLTLPVLNPQWGAQLAQRINWLAGQGISQAELQLNPAELGPMQVRIDTADNNAARVSFTTHQTATREALEAQLPRLRDLFAEQGLDLLDVDSQPFSDQSASQQDSLFSEGGDGEAHQQVDISAETAETEAAATADDGQVTPLVHQTVLHFGVDIFA